MKAAQTIEQKLVILETDPRIGRPLDDFPELRELVIPVGDSGYVLLYRLMKTATQLMYLLSDIRKKQGINKTVCIIGFFQSIRIERLCSPISLV